jgi:tetratricopeptide (TPR) repeat protein
MVDGRPLDDAHYIPPEAYAAYLDGVLLEEQGAETRAALAYEQALAVDPDAGGIWARLGAVRCLTDRRRADGAFVRARAVAPSLAEVWLAHARCALRRGDARTAAASALSAAALAPNDPETSGVVATALERAGEPARAERWRHALEIRRYGVPADEAHSPRPRGPDLALQALLLGQTDLAQSAAARVLLADPGNGDARVAGLSAADVARDDSALARWATPLPSARTRPGALGARLMAELLSRRIGPEAATAWVEAWAARGAPANPETRGGAPPNAE